MRNRFSTRQRRTAAAWAGALTLALAIAWGTGSAFAQSADDEDVPLDTKLFRQWMKDLGLRRAGDEGIEYRERAPLVVPPSRTLPPPQSEAAVTNIPAWPNDPDVKQRKADAAKKNRPHRTAAEQMEAEGRPLSRAELERGRVAAGTTSSTRSPAPEESARPMQPSELGSKSIFSDMFSSFRGDKGETAEFTGEPPRENLTAPPAGYQTPSPNHPYGITPKNEKKALTVEDRASGETR